MSKSESNQVSFEALMKRIEQLTEQLEDPNTGIEQSLNLYEEAMKLVGQAQTRLTDIQHKFEVIGQKGSLSEAKADTPGVSVATDNTPGVFVEKGEKDERTSAQNTLL